MPATRRLALCLATLLLTGPAAAAPPAPPAAPAPPVSATGEQVFAGARPQLLQIRTLVRSTGKQSSIGSGFVVDPQGLAVTNYHVVSEFALEPAAYRLEFVAADGRRGTLELLAIDVVHDLAIVRLALGEMPFLAFSPRALEGSIGKGENVFSLGNPLDLGFTIVEGTWNGPVAKSWAETIHFSGAINPGMSGGPAVSREGRVVGVNVAKRWDGDLVSFLVPARHAARLLAQARGRTPLAADAVRAEIARQLMARQQHLYQALTDGGWQDARFGRYAAPEPRADWMNCWAQTNAAEQPRPRSHISTTRCAMQEQVFLAGDLASGHFEYTHTHVRSAGLNAFQLAQQINHPYFAALYGNGGKRRTRPYCRDSFVRGDGGPTLRATWCARAYREFEGLYDVSVSMATQDRSDEALVSAASMQGVSWDTAMAVVGRFLEGIRWAK